MNRLPHLTRAAQAVLLGSVFLLETTVVASPAGPEGPGTALATATVIVDGMMKSKSGAT